MNMSITAQLAQASKEVKGLVQVTAKYHKTRTDLTVTVEGKDVPCFLESQDDIKLLRLEGIPVTDVMVMVTGAPALGRVINRSIKALNRICLQLYIDKDSKHQVWPLDWKEESGVFHMSGSDGVPLVGADLPFLFEIIYRMVRKAMTPVSWTQHDLTLYDLKQAIGVAHGTKMGDEEAISLDEWMVPRELIFLEDKKAELKEKRDKEKAKAKPKAKAKATTETTTEDTVEVPTQDPSPSTKTKGKGTIKVTGKKASLKVE